MHFSAENNTATLFPSLLDAALAERTGFDRFLIDIGEVFPENLASARVLEKNGFRLEETKAEAIIKGGKVMDVRVYLKA